MSDLVKNLQRRIAELTMENATLRKMTVDAIEERDALKAALALEPLPPPAEANLLHRLLVLEATLEVKDSVIRGQRRMLLREDESRG